MLFGWNKVPPGLHFFTTCMVALGTLMSTFWILASNSWMQTPQGFTIENGHVIPEDWLAIIFNPSFPYRLSHMAIAAFLSSAMFVGASAARHLLRAMIRRPYVKCFPWRCGWPCWSRRFRLSLAICTGSTRLNISRQKSLP